MQNSRASLPTALRKILGAVVSPLQMTGALQRSDPRCGPAVPEAGDTMALLKLRALVTIGMTVGWFKRLF